MADDEKLGHVSSCGADWEVVALTTSAYATTSEPDACQSDDGRDNQYQIDHEPSSALFMSQHFVFPPHEHENLSYHTEIDGRVMIFFDGEYDVAEPLGLSNQNSALYQDDKNCMEGSDCNKSGGSNPPCEAWWKRHAISLYKHAKETHSFWSIFMAAALMGLVVLGQQWKKEKVHLRQFKWQFSINNEVWLSKI
ncbi:hypothetical protein AXF42_Ash000892 [Apostasia shenzhenica]|uniref:Uncharacterized protein n=1 Tax=Apostasia shenzhenica TaxID=1088818 RepID=A0A2I0ATD3_9ASPA|nr:hypothetical protein AXF42_Ash000892 [Apostasia shenzhenica]